MNAENLSDEDQQILKRVAQIYVELMYEHKTESQDPFEMYADTLKVKFYSYPAQFADRFIQGYEAVLQEIEKGSTAGK
jgi:hypothetical protein